MSDLHTFTYHHLENEWIWPGSMPSRLSGNDSVPIADYGSSNVGTMKHVYRKGLDMRYGRIMQAIAGVHYNVSLPDDMWHALREMEKATNIPFNDYRSTRYFGMRAYGTLFGFVASGLLAGVGLGPIVAGAIYDSTGSYDLYLYLAIALAALVALLLATLGRYPDHE